MHCDGVKRIVQLELEHGEVDGEVREATEEARDGASPE